MNVSEAIQSRRTCRAFLDTPVSAATVRAILTSAARTPSGGNLQPWRVWALAGAELKALEAQVAAKIDAGQIADGPTEYLIYPTDMTEPYLSRKSKVGADMYAAIGVGRDDIAGQMAQFRRNFEFFGAPVGLFLALDRHLQPGQWADLGMFLQSLMLLAREHGLHTAPMESWALFHATVRAFLGMPDELMLFCGVGLGHMDAGDPINQWRAERQDVDDFAELRGF
jgi:nitroreductase